MASKQTEILTLGQRTSAGIFFFFNEKCKAKHEMFNAGIGQYQYQNKSVLALSTNGGWGRAAVWWGGGEDRQGPVQATVDLFVLSNNWLIC